MQNEPPEVEVVRRLFQAVENRDLTPMYEIYDPAVVIREAESLPYGGEHRGHKGMLEHATGYLRAWDRLQTEDDRRLEPQFFASGDQVFVRWRQKAHADDGRAVDLPAVSVYRLRGGRVIEATMHHFDTAALLGLVAREEGAP